MLMRDLLLLSPEERAVLVGMLRRGTDLLATIAKVLEVGRDDDGAAVEALHMIRLWLAETEVWRGVDRG